MLENATAQEISVAPMDYAELLKAYIEVCAERNAAIAELAVLKQKYEWLRALVKRHTDGLCAALIKDAERQKAKDE